MNPGRNVNIDQDNKDANTHNTSSEALGNGFYY